MQNVWLPNEAPSNINNNRQSLETSSKYKSYIKALIEGGEFEFQNKYYNQSSVNYQKYPQYLLEPDVVFWNIEDEANRQQLTLPNCPVCGGNLKTLPLISNYCIRQLYDVNKIKLLLSPILACNHTKKHQFLGHDPRILSKVALFIKVPFKLFHRAGITIEFSDFIFENLSEGGTIKHVHDTCQKNYKETFAAKINSLTQLYEHSQEVMSSHKLCFPSLTMISQSFLAQFDEMEGVIKVTTQNIGIPDGIIYIDDTFDIKLSTGSSKSPINRIMFGLNKDGNVMFWKLVNDKDCLKVRFFKLNALCCTNQQSTN